MALDPTDSVALNHQALTSLPETLADRVELRQLHLWGNALTCLPAWLWDLHRLEQLVLADNQLRSLSPKIAHLQRLQLLDLGHNALVAVPEELGSLTGLTGYLYLHDNQLAELPSTLGQLASLAYLNVSGNRLVSLPDGPRPTARWLRTARALVDAGDRPWLHQTLLAWLALCAQPVRDPPPAEPTSHNAQVLKGLAWCSAVFGDTELARTVSDVGIAAYKKLPGIGPRSALVGNACIFALGAMPGQHGLAHLARLRQRVVYREGLRLIETALQRAAAQAGLSRDDLEDLAVPVEVAARDLEVVLAGQRDRLERLFLVPDRAWSLRDWQARFIDHPLMARLASRLIWRFEDAAGQVRSGAWLDGTIVSADDQVLDTLAEPTRVRLWHPIDVPPQEVLAWRTWLERHQVRQPFKQAHREVYLLTAAERRTATYSNRFAAHLLRQHQLKALCTQRGWPMGLQGGGFDPGDCMPRLELPRWGLWAEFLVFPAEDEVPSASICPYVSTDQVRFGRLAETGALLRPRPEPHAVPLAEVPPMVLSEVLRDVDLFVGVASVGNDPRWRGGGPPAAHGSWARFAFGELAESARTRRAVLERLLPKLAILHGRWSLDDRFLIVRGELRTYKIHLGSGNILMSPNDQYLCIVPGRGGPSTDGLYLPFEGDATLSIIVSKALLLAADATITDSSITRQINAARG